MADGWATAPLHRGDRYQDWIATTRPGGPAVSIGWCAVVIEVRGETTFLENLQALQTESTAPPTPAPTPAASGALLLTAEEKRRLAARIAERIADPTGKVDRPARLFSAYVLEDRAFQNGGYAAYDRYEIQFAGPPIEGFAADSRADGAAPVVETPAAADTPVDPAPGAVAIAVIDDGIAFAHERFRIGRDRSRVERVWIQRAEQESDDRQGVNVGDIIDREQIDDWLRRGLDDEAIYREAGLIDFARRDYNPLAGGVAHGTHVMDLAAGADPFDGPPRDRPIYAVQLPAEATADTSGNTMGSYVLQAVRQIMQWADAKTPKIPLVINFSYGIFAGPKDGSLLLERLLEELIDHRRRSVGGETFIVLPSGNHYLERATAIVKLPQDADARSAEFVDWILPPDDFTPSFLEIWVDGVDGDPSQVDLTVKPPGGPPASAGLPAHGEKLSLIWRDEPIAGVYCDFFAPDELFAAEQASDNRIRVIVAVNATSTWSGDTATAPHGAWRITIAKRADVGLTAHVYAQRDDTPFGFPTQGRQSWLEHPDAFQRDPETGAYDKLGGPLTASDTLSAIATTPPCRGVMVVGAAMGDPDAGQSKITPSPYTSAGPTLSRTGPDVCAIADEGLGAPGVFAAGARSGALIAMSGTSVAAPQAARSLADALANGGVYAWFAGPAVGSAHRARLGAANRSYRRPDVPRRTSP